MAAVSAQVLPFAEVHFQTLLVPHLTAFNVAETITLTQSLAAVVHVPGVEATVYVYPVGAAGQTGNSAVVKAVVTAAVLGPG